MKKTSCLFAVLSLFVISCNSAKPINGFGEKDTTCRKYDATNDITYVSDISNTTPILVKGKWRKNELNTEKQFGHHPGIKNELGTVLELMIWKYDKEELLEKKSNEKVLNEILIWAYTFWNKETIKYEFLKSDKEASYHIYEVIENDRRRIELIGAKNKKHYRFFIYNFDPNRYTSIEDFLIGIFAIN